MDGADEFYEALDVPRRVDLVAHLKVLDAVGLGPAVRGPPAARFGVGGTVEILDQAAGVVDAVAQADADERFGPDDAAETDEFLDADVVRVAPAPDAVDERGPEVAFADGRGPAVGSGIDGRSAPAEDRRPELLHRLDHVPAPPVDVVLRHEGELVEPEPSGAAGLDLENRPIGRAPRCEPPGEPSPFALRRGEIRDGEARPGPVGKLGPEGDSDLEGGPAASAPTRKPIGHPFPHGDLALGQKGRAALGDIQAAGLPVIEGPVRVIAPIGVPIPVPVAEIGLAPEIVPSRRRQDTLEAPVSQHFGPHAGYMVVEELDEAAIEHRTDVALVERAGIDLEMDFLGLGRHAPGPRYGEERGGQREEDERAFSLPQGGFLGSIHGVPLLQGIFKSGPQVFGPR